MRCWLAKFRLSAAMDSGQRLSMSLRAGLEHSIELRNCFGAWRRLERELHVAVPPIDLPASLHNSVMQAVRRESLVSARSRLPRLPALRLAGAAALAVALVSIWWFVAKPSTKSAPAPQTSIPAPRLVGADALQI